MAEIPAIAEGMEVVGSDGVRVGLVDEADNNHIRLAPGTTLQRTSEGFHHYVPRSLVASVGEGEVRLTVEAGDAPLIELNAHPGAPRTRIEDEGSPTWGWNEIAVTAAAVGIVAVAGAVFIGRRGRGDEDQPPRPSDPQGAGGGATGRARSNSARK